MAEASGDDKADKETDSGAPAGILLRGRSWLGPLAGVLRSRRVRLGTAIVPVVAAAEAIAATEITADPLRDVETGTAVSGTIEAHAEPAAIETGKSGRIIVRGRGPARAGQYASALRILPGTAAKPVVIPVAVSVSASAVWGVACMMLGLTALGTVNVLTSEGALRTKQRDVLQAEQAFHEKIERSPVPERQEADAADIDREYAVALALLTAPHPLGVIDHRATDADPHLAAAERMQAELAKTLGPRPGEVEIADVLADWKSYRDVVHDLAELAPPSGAAVPRPPASAGLAALVDAYQARFLLRFVRLPIEYNTRQLNDVILGTRLADAGGRTEEALARARAARHWLQRASDDLAHGLTLAKNQKLLGFNLVSNAMQVQQRLADSEFPPDRQAAIQGLLDQAAATLATPGSPEGHADDIAFAEASKLVNKASVELTRARTDLVLQRFNAAIAKADAETGLDDVNDATAREQAAHLSTPELKIAGLRRILDVWRTKAAGVPDKTVQADVVKHINAVAAALDRGELKSVSPPYKELLDVWTAWGMRRVGEATAEVLAPYCEQDKQFDLVRVAQLTEALRQKEPRPESLGWEQELDRIRADTLRVDPRGTTGGAACRTALGTLEQRTLDLGNAIFRQETLDAPILVSDRRAALELLGMDAAALSRPRQLSLVIQTREAEREVGRRIRFVLENRDPAWGLGVTIEVDFGDGSPAEKTTAEAIARGEPIEHEYERPVLAHLRVAAAEQDEPLTASTGLLGDGSTVLSVRPSEITAAEALADMFLNARFALALLIAGVVYYWRFHAGKKVFGARGFDYIEAFALGFVVNAAVNDLPDQIARIVSLR